MTELILNYKNKLDINTTPHTTETWAQLHIGFSNLAQAINEVLYQTSYLGDEGWGSTAVTGGQFIITLTGVRHTGDDAQDYIFSDGVAYNWGSARETTLRITRTDGSKIIWDVVLAKITEGGGDANQPNAITVEIHGNGAPTIEPAV